MIYCHTEWLLIRDMEEADISELSDEAENPEEAARYFRKQAGHIQSGMCTGLIAFCQGQMAGYVYLYYRCKWGGLGNQGYPGIVDLYVPEKFRRKGIGDRLMDTAEQIAADYSDKVYLDVGLNSTFGSAHRLYARRGYIPDGKGCYYEEKVCGMDAPCINSDELTLCLVKEMEKKNRKKGYPSKEEAEKILQEAESCNPGPWGAHSRCVAECAEKIAATCGNMDVEKAYVLGLLHDIGRKFGARHLGHVYDGWKYMEWMGWPEAGRICLSHSFVCQSLEFYIGKFDILPDQEKELREALEKLEYDDYDRLIQLCDAIGTAEGVAAMEDRMQDIRRRYGNYPEENWKQNLALREYFEERMGRELYSLLGK